MAKAALGQTRPPEVEMASHSFQWRCSPTAYAEKVLDFSIDGPMEIFNLIDEILNRQLMDRFIVDVPCGDKEADFLMCVFWHTHCKKHGK